MGILRPDGDTAAGADVLAMTVRTYYMPNEDWQTICEQGRALREAAGTLTGHAAGAGHRPALDHAAVARAIGAGARLRHANSHPASCPNRSRPWSPTSATTWTMTAGSSSRLPNWSGTRRRADHVRAADGRLRMPPPARPGQDTNGTVKAAVRGYLVADIQAAIEQALRRGHEPDDDLV